MSQKSESKFNEELMKEYGWSKNSNFRVVDTIGVPHPFVIGTKHVVHAYDNHGGMLGEATMKAIPCDGCHQPYDKHETALLVQCLIDVKNDTKEAKELTAYMKQCMEKQHFKDNEYKGFVLMDGFTK